MRVMVNRKIINEDIRETSELTWFSILEVKKLLQQHTHSEIRTWLHFIDTICIKKQKKIKTILNVEDII